MATSQWDNVQPTPRDSGIAVLWPRTLPQCFKELTEKKLKLHGKRILKKQNFLINVNMFILYKAEKKKRLKHAVQQSKGPMALPTPLRSPQHPGKRNADGGSAAALGEASVSRAQRSRSPHQDGPSVTLRDAQRPFELPLKETPISTGEYTHSPLSNRKKKH